MMYPLCIEEEIAIGDLVKFRGYSHARWFASVYPEMNKWIGENASHPWWVELTPDPVLFSCALTVVFTAPVDALYFKLRWLA